MKKFALFLLIGFTLPLVKSQDVTSLQSLVALIRKPPATAFVLTDTLGDGSTCTINKVSGGTINYLINCSGATGSFKGGTQVGSSSTNFIFGNIICLTIANATASPIPANATWPNIPVNSVAFQCAVTGTTTPIVNVVSWP